ncbi:MAG TPA: hypothetical protein VFF22_04765 [Pseudomonas sp.]|nr:hypothetical protein [Pseudomonas sp.]
MELMAVVIAVSGALVGWVLAQFTAMAKDYLYRKRLRKLLIMELEELHDDIKGTIDAYTRQLHIYGQGGVSNEGPASISSFIFKNYYKDAVLGLSKSERKSFKIIHAALEAVNEDIDAYLQETRKIQEMLSIEGVESLSKERFDYWGGLIKTGYRGCGSLVWSISHHLDNLKNPEVVPMSDAHAEYLKHLDLVDHKMFHEIEAGKTIDREFFKKNYSHEDFERIRGK